MKRLLWIVGTLLTFLILGYLIVLPRLGQVDVSAIATSTKGDMRRGAYVATASGCYACHTDTKGKGKPFAGGVPFKTPFGTIYSPNITPDTETGIGNWSRTDFKRALVTGVRPDGDHYFPAFPYTSYAHMTDQDVADLKAYFDSIASVRQKNLSPDMPWPFSDRSLVGGWKLLNAPRTQRATIAGESGAISRGAYLVEVLGHCAECHTQRDVMGGYSGAPLAGNTRGPEGGKVPGIRSIRKKWSADEVNSYLADGMTPDGDFVGGHMAHVVDYSTSKLSAEDRHAITDYLLSLEPVN